MIPINTDSPLFKQALKVYQMVIDFNKCLPRNSSCRYSYIHSYLGGAPIVLAQFHRLSAGHPARICLRQRRARYLSLDNGYMLQRTTDLRYYCRRHGYGYALSVSDDDMLTIADASVIRIVDLAKSDLASGRMEVIQRTHSLDSALYNVWRENWETDSQTTLPIVSAITIITKFCARIKTFHRDLKSRIRTRFWILWAKFNLFLTLYLGAEIVLISIYVKKHPEIQKQVTASSECENDNSNRGLMTRRLRGLHF